MWLMRLLWRWLLLVLKDGIVAKTFALGLLAILASRMQLVALDAQLLETTTYKVNKP